MGRTREQLGQMKEAVLMALASGRTTHQVAVQFGISTSSVRNYRSQAGADRYPLSWQIITRSQRCVIRVNGRAEFSPEEIGEAMKQARRENQSLDLTRRPVWVPFPQAAV